MGALSLGKPKGIAATAHMMLFTWANDPRVLEAMTSTGLIDTPSRIQRWVVSQDIDSYDVLRMAVAMLAIPRINSAIKAAVASHGVSPTEIDEAHSSMRLELNRMVN